MHEVQRHPVEHQPQDPVVAEVHRRDRCHAFIQAHPRAARIDRTRLGRRQFIQFGARDARVIDGTLRVGQIPEDQPDGAHCTEQIERKAPVERGHQREDQHRCDGVAQPRGRVRDALCHAALVTGDPRGHRASRGRKRRAFAETQQHIRHNITSTVVVAFSDMRFICRPPDVIYFFAVKPRDCACDPGRSALRRSRAEGRDGVAEPLAAVHLLDEILVCEVLIDHDAPQALLDRMLRHGR
ncbi:hypothetical protein OKW27_001625 [Paraburkholderia sp. 35.1]